MKKYNIWRHLTALAITVLAICCIDGCGRTDRQDSKVTVKTNQTPENNAMFSIQDYQEKISTKRITLSECAKNYPEDSKAVQNAEYKNLDFTNCQFSDFPQTDRIDLLKGCPHGITVQESWDTIKNWLSDIKKDTKVNMKEDVYVVSEQLGLDENGDYFPFYDHINELESGDGAFITNNLCHIQLAANGIYSMSDGKITEYLGLSTNAVGDAMGAYSEDTVKAGPVSVLGDNKYELTDGEMSIQEGASLAKAYFEQGTPFPCADGVTIDVPLVNVFQLGDVYGYDYRIHRLYRSIPIAHMDYGTFRFYINGMESDQIQAGFDTKHAYVIDHSGVTAFAGYNESERLDVLTSETRMLGFHASVDNLSKNLAPKLDFRAESAGLAYLCVEFFGSDSKQERIFFPCWQFCGVNRSKGEHVNIYSDVLTGDIYYYTYTY